jgi:hypothetical protein
VLGKVCAGALMIRSFSPTTLPRPAPPNDRCDRRRLRHRIYCPLLSPSWNPRIRRALGRSVDRVVSRTFPRQQ